MPTTSRRHLLLMIVGLVLFSALAVSSHWALRSVQDATAERAAARMGLITLAGLSAAMAEIERGQRGYLLTGGREYLQPYEAAVARYQPLMQTLRREVEHLPAVRGSLSDGAGLLEERVALARENIAARRAGRALSLAPDGSIARGRVAGERVRAWIAGTEAALRLEIERLDARVNRISRTALVTEALLGVFGAFAIFSAVLLLDREQTRRLEAEFEIHRANFALENRVRERTAELEDARAQLSRFAHRLDQGIEAERRRLSREVHDQLGQVFTALRMGFAALASRYAVESGERERVDALLLEGVQTARRISAELRPPLLDELGLADALAFRADGFRDETGIDCEVDMSGTDDLDREQATQLFRIVQEALTNVARHSGATGARVHGRRLDGEYELVVEDDGRGLGGKRTGSLGLPHMRERAALAGGRLQLERPETGGLRIRVRVPLTGRAA